MSTVLLQNAEELLQARTALNINQTEMAKKLGISQSYYAMMEKGKRPLTNDIIAKVVELCNETITQSQETVGNTYRAARSGSRVDLTLLTEDKRLEYAKAATIANCKDVVDSLANDRQRIGMLSTLLFWLTTARGDAMATEQARAVFERLISPGPTE